MTVREVAAELGVSVPTLYRRLKAEGIDIKGLRDGDTGSLTAEGASIIAALFSGSGDDKAVRDIIGGASQGVAHDTACDDTALQVEAAVLRVKLEAAEGEAGRLRAEVDSLKAERDRLLTLLEGEQRQRVQLLEDGNQRRRGWFGWFRRGRGTD